MPLSEYRLACLHSASSGNRRPHPSSRVQLKQLARERPRLCSVTVLLKRLRVCQFYTRANPISAPTGPDEVAAAVKAGIVHTCLRVHLGRQAEADFLLRSTTDVFGRRRERRLLPVSLDICGVSGIRRLHSFCCRTTRDASSPVTFAPQHLLGKSVTRKPECEGVSMSKGTTVVWVWCRNLLQSLSKLSNAMCQLTLACFSHGQAATRCVTALSDTHNQ